MEKIRNNFLGLPMDMLLPRDPMWNMTIPSFKTDIVENENNYEIIMDMPGFSKEDVKITVKNNTLIITAKKETKIEDKEKNYILKERSNHSMSRSFQIKNLDSEKIKASFKDGLLQITIDKPQKTEETKTINIE